MHVCVCLERTMETGTLIAGIPGAESTSGCWMTGVGEWT